MLFMRPAWLQKLDRKCSHVPECTAGNIFFNKSFVLKKKIVTNYLLYLPQPFKQCWKSRVRDAYGVESVSRGCTVVHEHIPLTCINNSGRGPRKRHTSGQFNIECCHGDYCNNGSFPELPPLNPGKIHILVKIFLLIFCWHYDDDVSSFLFFLPMY